MYGSKLNTRLQNDVSDLVKLLLEARAIQFICYHRHYTYYALYSQ